MNVRANRNIFLVLSAFLLGIACTATGRTIYVDCDTPGPTHDGKNWATAFKYLLEGLTTA